MKLTSLLLIILCLYPLVSFCSSICNLPTEDDLISVCAFCSENHAGVRWMVHEHNNNLLAYDSQRIDTISIQFRCHDPENNTVFSCDDCFNGDYLPYLSTVNTGEWRWHILERHLSEGTQCNFTATAVNSFYSSSHTLTSTQCTVKSPLECSEDSSNCTTSPTPAVCSGEPDDSACSCSCSDGFSEDVISYDRRDNRRVNLLCRNKDECAMSGAMAHQCEDTRDCVDTEGGYYCNSSMIQSTTISAITATVSSRANWIDPTATTRVSSIAIESAATTKVSSISHDSRILVSPSTEHESEKVTSTHVHQSTTISIVKSDTIIGADIKLLVTIPLSVTVFIVLVLISLMFIIALNRYYSNDSINKIINSWQVHDKFDPDFFPAVTIDKKSAVKRSLESILAPLEKVPDRDRTQGAHVLVQCYSVDQDGYARKENACDTSDTTRIVIWNDETTDSGLLSGTRSSSSTNSQNANVTPVSEVTGGQTEIGSQEHTEEVSEYPSGANIGAANSLGWTSSGSVYHQMTDFGTSHASTMPCDRGHQHERNNQANMETTNFCVSGLSQNGVDDGTGMLSANNGSLSFSLEMDDVMALPLDASTNDHSIAHDTSTIDFAAHAVTDEYFKSKTLNCYGLQATMDTISESQNTLWQMHEERSTRDIDTNTMFAHASGIGGSASSLMCDIEY